MSKNPQIKTSITYPGEYDLAFLEIDSVTGQTLDLRDMMMEFNVYEDIFENTMSCDITIMDTHNLIANFPIIGEETIRLGFNTPVYDSDFDGSNIAFRCYSITSRKRIKDRGEIYTIHGISEHFMEAEQQRVSKAFVGKRGDEIVNDIYNEYIDKNGFRLLNIEETKNIVNCVIPNWTPLEAIRWISKRCLNNENSPTYLFYENIRDGFNFKSISGLTQNPVREKFTYEVVDPREGVVLNQIEDYIHSIVFDQIQNGFNAMIGSKIISNDIVNKTIEEFTYNGIDSWNEEAHLEPIPPLTGKASLNFGRNKNVNMGFYPKHESHFSGNSGESNNVELWKSQRFANLQVLNNYRLSLHIPGNSNISIGDVVEISIPSNEVIDGHNKSNLLDSTYSGKYLVLSIRHIIKPDVYKMVIEVAKDGFSEQVIGRESSENFKRFISSQKNYNNYF